MRGLPPSRSRSRFTRKLARAPKLLRDSPHGRDSLLSFYAFVLRESLNLEPDYLRLGRALPGSSRPIIARITLDAPTSGRARFLPI